VNENLKIEVNKMEIDIYYKGDEQYFLFSIRSMYDEKKVQVALEKIQDLNIKSDNVKIFDVKYDDSKIVIDVIVLTDNEYMVSIITDLKRIEEKAFL
jgi:hypothetical protein